MGVIEGPVDPSPPPGCCGKVARTGPGVDNSVMGLRV